VPDPFLVLATMNPIESEGTYPLPEAQVDRFMMKVVVGYPTPREELEVVRRSLVPQPKVEQVLTVDDLHGYQRMVERVFVDQPVAEYAVALVAATRNPHGVGLGALAPYVDYGASPRASLALVRGAQALALLRGRSYALPGEVADLAHDVLRHRLVLTYQALAEEVAADRIVEAVLGAVHQPQIDLAHSESRVAEARAAG
jgi:MoxR-like ATPase